MSHIILLILGEIWSKGSNFTSLLLVEVFAEVAEVNTEALNIKSHQPQQNDVHIVTSAFYLPWQKMLKFEGCACILSISWFYIIIPKLKHYVLLNSSIASLQQTGLVISILVFFISIANKFLVKNFVV